MTGEATTVRFIPECDPNTSINTTCGNKPLKTTSSDSATTSGNSNVTKCDNNVKNTTCGNSEHVKETDKKTCLPVRIKKIQKLKDLDVDIWCNKVPHYYQNTPPKSPILVGTDPGVNEVQIGYTLRTTPSIRSKRCS